MLNIQYSFSLLRRCFPAVAGFLLSVSCGLFAQEVKPLRVVTTLPDYGVIARAIGGDRVTVTSIVKGNQDAHFIRPKPSFARDVSRADLLIATGLDLELWLPSVVNLSGNRQVASGQPGFVAASKGMHLIEKPEVLSRSEGGLHIYGNPHVTCSPVNMRVAARNICTGLCTVSPADTTLFRENCTNYIRRIDEMLFGKELVNLLTGDLLAGLTEQGKLVSFLEGREFQGEKLIHKLGGVMARARSLRGMPIVTYHKGWAYFIRLLGLNHVGTIEPKPGIPPSARHKLNLLSVMSEKKVQVVWAASYFSSRTTKSIAEQAGARALVVPAYVGGLPELDTYCKLFTYWVDSLLEAVSKEAVK